MTRLYIIISLRKEKIFSQIFSIEKTLFAPMSEEKPSKYPSYSKAMSWKEGDKITIVSLKGNIYTAYFVQEWKTFILATEDEDGRIDAKFNKPLLDFEKTKEANTKKADD